MAVIRVLDKHTAELIAAGEVVERPASVAKELLENAIDAGATQITVAIESGGVRLIEVSDNGTGIEPAYISTAFIRHATSKIASEDDLAAIHTLGFRGEALASIASVARVELLTCTEGSDCAVLYRNEGGEEQPAQPAARAVGTTIRVRDLFFNTPARMKFLKKDASEGTFVADVVTRQALSHPEISFKFVREGKTQYVTPGDGQLRSAAYAVLGREFSRDLLEVASREGLYAVHGLITPPRSCRASRSMQYFYINGRAVNNRTMMAGMETAFKGTTMQGKFPGGVLMLEMPAELDDENDQFWYTYEIAGTGSRDGVSYSMSTRTQGTVGASGQATITINADDLLGTGSDLLQGSYVLTVTIYDSADAGTTNVTRTGVEVMRLLSGLAASGTINLDTQVVNEEGFLVLVDDSIGDKIVIAADDFVDNTANEIDGSKPFNFDITFSEASGLAGTDVTIRGFLDGEELNASTSPYTFTTSTTDPAMSEGADIRTIFSGLPGGQHVLTYVISENGTQIGVGSLTILAKVKADITITPTP